MGSRLEDDPRIDARMKAVYGKWPPMRWPDVATREELLALEDTDEARADAEAIKAMSVGVDYEPFAPSAGLNIRTVSIASAPDGNRINLLVIAPQGGGPRPCVYYVHGGGMYMMSCYDPQFQAWGRLLAHQGVAVVMIDFRNSLRPSSAPEVAPYPAGLNDCVSGLRWLRDHGRDIGVDPDRIIVAGESGGGNLSIAIALKLKREGELALVKGLFVMCPYLAGAWPQTPGSSALENRGILVDEYNMFSALVYGIGAYEARDPMAWPGFATVEDVKGFPPVVVNVNEADHLRDDGVIFYRLLLRAGVSARCRQLMGTMHATETNVVACPEISRDAARDVAAFCVEATGGVTRPVAG